MTMLLLKLFFAVVITEAVAEILSEAVIFERVRAWLEKDPKKPRLVGILARCGYCQSVWLGVGLVFAFRLELSTVWDHGLRSPWWLESIMLGLVVHRFSNLWHDALSWVKYRRIPLG